MTLRRAVAVVSGSRDSANAWEPLVLLILLEHEACGHAAGARHLIYKVAQHLQQVFGGSGIESRTHVLYYINVNWLGPCTNFLQISSRIFCLVVDEGKNPGAEIARRGQAWKLQSGLHTGFL